MPGMARLSYDADRWLNLDGGSGQCLEQGYRCCRSLVRLRDILKTEEGDHVKDQERKVGGRRVVSKRGVIDTNACCGSEGWKVVALM